MNDDVVASSDGGSSRPAQKVSAPGLHDIEPKQQAPWKKVHTLLRGRYLIAAVLAVIGASAGGAYGWYSWSPVYTSSGVISIKPRLEKIIFDTEDSRIMPMFDAFVDSQLQLMRSARVLDMATSSARWMAVRDPNVPSTAESFGRGLWVGRSGGLLVNVNYTDADKKRAQVAVDVVVEAYMRLYGEKDVEREATRLRVLTERRGTLTDQLVSLERQVRQIADRYATASLEPLYDFKLEEFQKLESKLKEVELALATATERRQAEEAEAASGDGNTATSIEQVYAEASPGEVAAAAAADPGVRGAWISVQSAERRVQEIRDNYGIEHRAYKAALDNVAAAKNLLNMQMAAYRVGQAGPGLMVGDIGQLQKHLERLRNMHQTSLAEVQDLGRSQLEIADLEREIGRVRSRLEETKLEIEKMNVESAVSGRIEIIDGAREPSAPSNERERRQLVVMGAGGGGMIGVGLVLAFALLDRRLRFSEEVITDDDHNQLPGLGILPQLPDQQETPEQAVMTAYAVHHIRSMLQVTGTGAPVLAVTGPTSGSGKTSLAVALGLSFAAAGSRTLLIDCDFIGGGLTVRMERFRRERLGRLLRKSGDLSPEQLDEAERLSRERGIRIGEALVELGFIDEKSLHDALTLQKESRIGLLQALKGAPTRECIAETGVPNLWILPIPDGSASQISLVSPSSVRRVLDEVSVEYEQVLIDLGPVPGSVEASVFAAESDRVVVVVSRGDRRPSYDRCVSFLRKLNTSIAGVVFNRADEVDVERSATLSAVSRSRANQMPAPQEAKRPLLRRFGPLGAGMAGGDGAPSNGSKKR